MESTPTVAESILLVNGYYARVLFDPGATHSFISATFSDTLKNCPASPFGDELLVRTPTGESVRVVHAIPSIDVSVSGRCLKATVYILEMQDFDVILGID